VIVCATTAREPLFDGALVRDQATVVAIGSHEPDAREVDERLAGRATVVVESRASALREAGDVIQAIEAGALDPRTRSSRSPRSSAATRARPRPPAPVQEHRDGVGGPRRRRRGPRPRRRPTARYAGLRGDRVDARGGDRRVVERPRIGDLEPAPEERPRTTSSAPGAGRSCRSSPAA
jgi:hypothetical protein